MKIIIKDKKINFEDKIFITGFRSHIGQVGYITTKHLVDFYDAKRIGFIETKYMTPSAYMGKQGILAPYELYQLDSFIIFIERVPLQKIEWNLVTKGLAKWVIKKGFKEAVIIGGLDNEFKEESENIKVVSTSFAIEKVKHLGYSFLDENLGMYGPLALLLSYFEIHNFPAYALLAYAERGRPDPRAAANAVSALSKIYNVSLDTTKLLEDAEEIEKEIQAILDQQQKVMEKDRPSNNIYI
ncbi:MAG: proteasome assembly chaperone family protein [Candidatus Asgardarchaeia archaeon]